MMKTFKIFTFLFCFLTLSQNAQACKVAQARWENSKATLTQLMEKIDKMKQFQAHGISSISIGSANGGVEAQVNLSDVYGKCKQLVFSVKQPMCSVEIELLREQDCAKK